MRPWTVDVLIAVHDPNRPVERAIRSVVRQIDDCRVDVNARVRVQLIIHNTAPAPVLSRLDSELQACVDVQVFEDGIASPAGPFNAGLDSSSATYVVTMGSDDALEPGTLPAWIARARKTEANAVIASLRTSEGVVLTPYMRPCPRTYLDPLKDGLAYRTAPLGLLRRERLEQIGFRYTSGGHLNGEDVEPGLRLWFTGERIVYPYRSPCYRVFDDMGASRATSALGAMEREVGFLPQLLNQEWLRTAPRAVRAAVAVKIARAQLIGAIVRRVQHARAASDWADFDRELPFNTLWNAADAHFVARSTQALQAISEGGLISLSWWEQRLLETSACAMDTQTLLDAWGDLPNSRGFARVFPRTLGASVHRTARPRTFVTQQLTQRLGVFKHPEPPAAWVEAQQMPNRCANARE